MESKKKPVLVLNKAAPVFASRDFQAKKSVLPYNKLFSLENSFNKITAHVILVYCPREKYFTKISPFSYTKIGKVGVTVTLLEATFERKKNGALNDRLRIKRIRTKNGNKRPENYN